MTPRQEIPVHFGASPWAWGFNTRFENPLQALMEAAPFDDDPAQSAEELNVLRDAVASAMDRCTPEHRFVLEAHLSEGVSFRPLALRLGVEKSQAHRIYKKALDECRTHLLRVPAVRERLGLMTYWNQHAEHILNDEFEDQRGDVVISPAGWLDHINTCLTRAKHVINYTLDGDIPTYAAKHTIERHLVGAAHGAVSRLEDLDMWSVDRLRDLLVYKQSKYGHDNILDFGMIGVGIRTCDKRARIMNLGGQDQGDMGNESIVDTLDDIVGYAVIARMLIDNVFTSELEPV